ncbi:MAG: hypothetical protein ACLPM3_14525 [Terracidiphilus sp.]
MGIDYLNRLVSAARAPASPNTPLTVLTAGSKFFGSSLGQKNARYPLSISKAFLARFSPHLSRSLQKRIESDNVIQITAREAPRLLFWNGIVALHPRIVPCHSERSAAELKNLR